MLIKTYKSSRFLAFTSPFIALAFAFSGPVLADNNLPITEAADKVVLTAALVPGFYQFNNLDILKGPSVDEPPTTIEVIQKNEKSCVVYENAKDNQPIPCVFDGTQNNIYAVQIEKITTLLSVDREPALLSDFSAGDKLNITGWLLADGQTIRAAVIRNLGTKDFHQTLSGTIKKVTAEGFVLVMPNGDEVFVNTPVVEGAQVTVKGVFDKVNMAVSNVLSMVFKPNIVLEAPAEEAEKAEKPASAAKPSTLFKNFLKVFGL
jgi:hypothetical protein